MSERQAEILKDEFNRWAESGRGDGMEKDHLPITMPVLERMRLGATDNVLDVGCGSGWLARRIAERVSQGRIVGIDLSDEMIRLARRQYLDQHHVMFAVGEVEEIPWDANFFTHAISIESAYYWPDPPAGLREIYRVLRPGGRIWVLINYYRDNPHCHQWGPLLNVKTQLLSAAQWTGLLEGAGFVEPGEERIPDLSPSPEVYNGRWFRDAAQLRAFKADGALLVTARKE